MLARSANSTPFYRVGISQQLRYHGRLAQCALASWIHNVGLNRRHLSWDMVKSISLKVCDGRKAAG